MAAPVINDLAAGSLKRSIKAGAVGEAGADGVGEEVLACQGGVPQAVTRSERPRARAARKDRG